MGVAEIWRMIPFRLNPEFERCDTCGKVSLAINKGHLHNEQTKVSNEKTGSENGLIFSSKEASTSSR